MQTKRNDTEDRKDRQEVAESADQLRRREPAEGRQREDFALRHLWGGSGHFCQSTATVSRRLFGAVLAAPLLRAARAPSVGVQLESVRSQLKRTPDSALKALAEIGFKDAEGYSRADTLALLPKLREYGLAVRSCQVEVPLITQNWDPYPQFKPVPVTEAIAGIAAAGISYFTMSPIGNNARGDGDDFYRRTADRMNTVGELCRKAKLRFAWQPHALDFEGRPGMRPIDIYKERLDLKLVAFELDVVQAVIAHQDPARLFKEWKDHVPLVRVTGGGLPAGSGADYIFLGDPLESLRDAYNSMGSR